MKKIRKLNKKEKINKLEQEALFSIWILQLEQLHVYSELILKSVCDKVDIFKYVTNALFVFYSNYIYIRDSNALCVSNTLETDELYILPSLG